MAVGSLASNTCEFQAARGEGQGSKNATPMREPNSETLPLKSCWPDLVTVQRSLGNVDFPLGTLLPQMKSEHSHQGGRARGMLAQIALP